MLNPLPKWPAPYKILATMFLIVLSAGFYVSHLYLDHTVAAADGEAGFAPSLRDITVHFHGDAQNTRLKNMVQGSMRKYFSEEENALKLTPAEQVDLDAVVDWSDRGGPEDEFWNPQDHEEFRNIGNIFYNRGCLDCHARDAAGPDAKPKSPLETYADTQRFLKGDPGISEGKLLMLGHVHLLGMGLMFLGVGIFLTASTWPASVRTALVIAGFGSILLDIGGWFAVKFGGGDWAPLVMAGGLLMGVSFGLSVLAVMYDLWIRKLPVEYEG